MIVVERYNSECIQQFVKYGGGSVIVWGCISASGDGGLFKTDSIVNT